MESSPETVSFYEDFGNLVLLYKDSHADLRLLIRGIIQEEIKLLHQFQTLTRLRLAHQIANEERISC
jgi:hypothetical protein